MPYIGTAPASELKILDINGEKFILDADADTHITADTDDQIDIAVGGTDVATLTNSNLVLKGTTPTLTVGDAGAEDTKIVFDGNAQDFHIGLDDTADDLVIGLGSALGTTTHMAFDETGAIIKPLQPAVLATNTVNRTNVTGNNTNYTAIFNNEVADRNGDFASNTFTAPVTGLYLLIAHIWTYNMTSSASTWNAFFTTSNRTYDATEYWVNSTSSSNTQHAASLSVLADMDASDTATANIQINGEGSDVVEYAAGSSFCATLIC
jgi:hypothetical protein